MHYFMIKIICRVNGTAKRFSLNKFLHSEILANNGLWLFINLFVYLLCTCILKGAKLTT